ncbi:MAG: hypothetical protein K2L94_03920, partial [Alphaproteobacteria bacterium]|nr:hypothetical protein [Alphaproteobacteria bacterium]
MKKILTVLGMCAWVMPAVANEYGDYDVVYDTPCPVCACDCVGGARDNYTGVRVYKNEHAAYSYNLSNGHKEKYQKDNFGFGTTVGNNLTDYVRVEYETLYMGAQYSKYDTDFEYDIWANMLNAYVLWDFDNAVAPYAGAGVGLLYKS